MGERYSWWSLFIYPKILFLRGRVSTQIIQILIIGGHLEEDVAAWLVSCGSVVLAHLGSVANCLCRVGLVFSCLLFVALISFVWMIIFIFVFIVFTSVDVMFDLWFLNAPLD